MKSDLAAKERRHSNKENLKETFDWMADRYLDQTIAVSRGRYPGWMDHVVDVVAQARPESVADVGCGPGYLVTRLKARLPGSEVVGVDNSPRMLDLVPPDITTECRDLLDWGHDGGTQFDVIALTFVLRDQRDPGEVLRSLKSRLAPGGRLVVLETQTPEGWRKKGFQLYFHRWMPWWGAHMLARDWPGPRELAPYRWLSDSHAVWHQSHPLPDALEDAGYRNVQNHRRPNDVVMLWSAEKA